MEPVITRLRTTVFLVLLLTLGWANVATAAQTVVILLDDSGSMNGPMRSDRRVIKIAAAKTALETVFSQLPDDATVGVLALNSRVATQPGSEPSTWIIPLSKLDRNAVQASVNRINAEGGTPLGTGMKVAADALLERRKQSPYGEFRLLIVTDGEAQDPDLVDRYLPEIRQRNLSVDVIGVSMATDHSLATRVDTYRRADNMEALTTAIQDALAETPIDPQNPDQLSEDFELLAALPDEIAVAAIEAMTTNDNRPIGQTMNVAVSNGQTTPPPAGTIPLPNSGVPNQSNRSMDALPVVAIVFFLIVAGSILLSGKKRR